MKVSKKYAVAYVNLFDDNLKIIIIEAFSESEALVEGTRNLVAEMDSWLDSLLEKTPEEIEESFFDADQLIVCCLIE